MKSHGSPFYLIDEIAGLPGTYGERGFFIPRRLGGGLFDPLLGNFVHGERVVLPIEQVQWDI